MDPMPWQDTTIGQPRGWFWIPTEQQEGRAGAHRQSGTLPANPGSSPKSEFWIACLATASQWGQLQGIVKICLHQPPSFSLTRRKASPATETDRIVACASINNPSQWLSVPKCKEITKLYRISRRRTHTDMDAT